MTGSGLAPDRIVSLLAIVLCMAILARGQTFRSVRSRQRILFAVLWAAIIGLVAALAQRLGL